MKNDKQSSPGDGIRSLKTSNVFRLLNFELYTKPVSYSNNTHRKVFNFDLIL